MSFCLPTLNLPDVSTHYILISVLGFSFVFLTYFLFALFPLQDCLCVCWFASDFTWVLYLMWLTHECGWIQEILKRSNDDGVSPWERGGKGVCICWEVSHGDSTTFHSPAQSAQRAHHPHPVCKLSCHSCMHLILRLTASTKKKTCNFTPRKREFKLVYFGCQPDITLFSFTCHLPYPRE